MSPYQLKRSEIMKKLTALMLVFILVAAMFAGCRNPMDSGATENSGEDTVPSHTTAPTETTANTLPTNATATSQTGATEPTVLTGHP